MPGTVFVPSNSIYINSLLAGGCIGRCSCLLESTGWPIKNGSWHRFRAQQSVDAVSLVGVAINSGEPFDVVILDIRMPPGINGVEVGKQI